MTILNALFCLCEANYGSGNGMNDECHISDESDPGSTCQGSSFPGKCFGISKYLHLECPWLWCITKNSLHNEVICK